HVSLRSAHVLLYHSDGHHRDLHSFPTRRSSDLRKLRRMPGPGAIGVLFLRRIAFGFWGAPEARTTEIVRQHEVGDARGDFRAERSEEHTSELQSLTNLVCRLLLEKKTNQHRSRH